MNLERGEKITKEPWLLHPVRETLRKQNYCKCVTCFILFLFYFGPYIGWLLIMRTNKCKFHVGEGNLWWVKQSPGRWSPREQLVAQPTRWRRQFFMGNGKVRSVGRVFLSLSFCRSKQVDQFFILFFIWLWLILERMPGGWDALTARYDVVVDWNVICQSAAVHWCAFGWRLKNKHDVHVKARPIRRPCYWLVGVYRNRLRPEKWD